METLVFYTAIDYLPFTALSFGTVAARSSDDTMMQVVNLSDTYQASDITVSVDGTHADQLYLSLDGEDFGPVIEIGDVPPGSGCIPFWLRRVTPSTFSGPASAELTAVPDAWSDLADVSTTDNVALGSDVDLAIELPDPFIPTED